MIVRTAVATCRTTQATTFGVLTRDNMAKIILEQTSARRQDSGQAGHDAIGAPASDKREADAIQDACTSHNASCCARCAASRSFSQRLPHASSAAVQVKDDRGVVVDLTALRPVSSLSLLISQRSFSPQAPVLSLLPSFASATTRKKRAGCRR